MIKYRTFLGDWTEDVEAESEEDAANKMAALVVERLTSRQAADYITVWEIAP